MRRNAKRTRVDCADGDTGSAAEVTPSLQERVSNEDAEASQSRPTPGQVSSTGVLVVDEMVGDPNHFLVFNDHDIDTLQVEYRMLCTRSFLAPDTKRTVKEIPPGVLLAEQVHVLVENGWARVRRVHMDGLVNDDESAGGTEAGRDASQPARAGKKKRRLEVEVELVAAPLEYVLLDASEVLYPTSATYLKRLITFRDLWRKGYYLTPGVNFGCDYLAYERLPGEKHSKFMVMCVDASTEVLRPLDLVATTRLGTQVNKRLLLAFVTPYTLVPQYSVMGWWKGDE